MTGGPWLLHGLASQCRPLTGETEPHVLLPLKPFSAIISPISEAQIAEKDEQAQHDLVRRHNALLCAYAETGDVLPIRVGTALKSRNDVRRVLERDHARFAAAFTRVRGAREYEISLQERKKGPTAPDASAAGGRAYLSAQRAARDRRHAHGRRLDQLINDLGRLLATRCRGIAFREPHRQTRRAARALALVDVETTQKLVQDLGAFADAAEIDGFDVVLSGPWPPYSFAAEAVT